MSSCVSECPAFPVPPTNVQYSPCPLQMSSIPRAPYKCPAFPVPPTKMCPAFPVPPTNVQHSPCPLQRCVLHSPCPLQMSSIPRAPYKDVPPDILN